MSYPYDDYYDEPRNKSTDDFHTYGVRNDDGIPAKRKRITPEDRKSVSQMPGSRAARAPREKGLPVSTSQAKMVVEAAMQSGRRLRDATKTGQGVHQAREEHNANMAHLQQIHTGLHQSVLAITHLEGMMEAGETGRHVADLHAEARRNLASRLAQGGNARGGR